MFGITSFAAYVPRWRLDREAIAATLGTVAGIGTRAVASFDEDSTSLGVEAARAAIDVSSGCDAVVFSTTQPAYSDKTNATTVHAALGLSASVAAYDLVGSTRCGFGAIRWGVERSMIGGSTLAVLADIRTGLPGSADESTGGDGAAAFTFGDDGVLASVLGVGSVTAEILERWRAPGDTHSRVWEERFSEGLLREMATTAVLDACSAASVDLHSVDHVVVSGLHGRAVRAIVAELGLEPSAVADDLVAQVGNAGCAHAGIVLCDVLERADPGQRIAVVTVGDGADAIVVRAEPALLEWRRGRHTVRAQMEMAASVDYATFLTWRGMLRREPPRRPDPVAPAAPPSLRRSAWKFSFCGSRCKRCDMRHLPPNRVCMSCRSVDEMTPDPVSSLVGTITTFTVDRLAFSLSPPVVVAVVDFDGGGRFQCEMTDADVDRIAIGDRVEMTFRRLHTAEGVHNYFWKARPARSNTEA